MASVFLNTELSPLHHTLMQQIYYVYEFGKQKIRFK